MKILKTPLFTSLFWYLSLHYSIYCFWLSFVWAMPLYGLTIQNKKLSAGYFFVMAGLFYLLHFKTLFILFYHLDALWYMYLPIFALIIYFSAFYWLIFLLFINMRIHNCLKVFLTLTLSQLCINFLSLFFIEFWCGYGLSNPALSWCAQPLLFNALCILSKEGVFVVVQCTSWLFALAWVHKQRHYLLCGGALVAVMFAIGTWRIVLPQQNTKNTIVYCDIPSGDPHSFAEQLNNIIKEHKDNNTIFVTQESNFPFDINTYGYILHWLPHYRHIIMHVHINCGGQLKSAMIYVYNGTIQQIYYKKRLVPIAEYIPGFLIWLPGLQKLFLQSGAFYADTQGVEYFTIAGKLYQPFICSDLFLESWVAGFNNPPPLVCYNLSWFSDDFQQIMGCFIAYRRHKVLFWGHSF